MDNNQYQNWSGEELVEEIKKLKKRKKYGVVWEPKEEEVVELCKEKLPVLVENKGKEIKTDKNKPVDILIEGDNYHALSVLNYTHNGKIDVIYIDPPYNTGKKKEWKFNDHYVDKNDAYRHSKWLSFMEKRLKLAKNLLKTSGVFFISIGEEEFAQLKVLCDEIFDEKNNISTVIVKSNPRGKQQMKIAATHEYLLVYAKNINNLNFTNLELSEKEVKQYNKKDDEGNLYRELGLRKRGAAARRIDVPNLYYPIYVNPKNGEVSLKKTNEFSKTSLPILSNNESGRWRWGKKKFEQYKARLYGRIVKGSKWDIFERDYLLKDGKQKSMKAKSIWDEKELNYENAKKEMKEIFKGECPFDYPKTVFLMKKIINLSMPKEGILLDYFAGSGTAGHALLEINNMMNTNMKFILATNDENGICTKICYPRVKKILSKKKGYLKYFKTDFVNAQSTDKNRKRLVDKSTEMLCLKEYCFDEIKKGRDFRIFRDNQGKHMGIVYSDEGIEVFKKEVKRINKKFIVYVFSLDESAREEEFEDIKRMVELKPIPAVILNVYRRIFK